MRNRAPILLSDICSFATGIAVALAQVAIVRELFGALEGHEVSVALSLAVWLGGIGAGAGLGGLLARRGGIDAGHLLAAVAALAVAAAAGIALARDAHSLLDLTRGASIGVAGSIHLTAAVAGPAALVTGILLPLFAAASGPGRGLRCGPARFYMVEGLGTAAGAAAAPFLVGAVPAVRLVAVAHALAAATIALAAWRGLSRPTGRGRIAGIAGLAALAALALAAGPIETATQRRRTASLGTSGDLVATVETPYGRLDVVRARAADGRGRAVVFSNGKIAAAAPDPYGDGEALDLAMLQHPAPRRVTIVGASPPDAARAARAHGASGIALAAFDPWILPALAAALDPADLAEMEGTAAIDEDPRFHVEHLPAGGLDLLVVFAQDPTTATANRHLTREAFAAAAGALGPDGVLVLRLPWSANVPDPATLAYGRSVVRALRESFAAIVAAPGVEVTLFASRSPWAVTSDAAVLAARASERPGLAGTAFPAEYLATLFPADRVAAARRDLGLDGPVAEPPNTDLRPVAYLDRVIAHLERGAAGRSGGASRAAAVLRALASVPPWIAAAAAALVPLLALATRRSRRRAGGPEAAVLGLLVGGTGMAFQMLVMVAYQNHTGRLYVGYALLTGAFMAGLAAGTRLGERLLAVRGAGAPALLARIETVAAAILLAAAAAAAQVASSGALLGAASVAAGILTGAPFPGLVAAAAPERIGTARAGAWASAGDHLGAAVGAPAALLVMLPAWGLRSSLLVLAAARACSALAAASRAR